MRNLNELGIIGNNKNRCSCYVCQAQAELRRRYDIEGNTGKMERGEAYLLQTPQMVRAICPTHIGCENLMSYHWRDWTSEATPVMYCDCTTKKGAIESHTVGTEFEICESAGSLLSESMLTYARCELEFTFNSIAESDCTVLMEIPSGIVEGLAKYRLIKTFDNIDVNGQTLTKVLFSSDSSAGAHTHVYCDCIGWLRNRDVYRNVFEQLEDYLLANREKTVAFFGRYFGGWSETCSWYAPTEHTNWINLQHNKTVECRLPRILSYKQYIEVLKWWRESIAVVNMEHRAGTEAGEIGKILVEIANKYIH